MNKSFFNKAIRYVCESMALVAIVVIVGSQIASGETMSSNNYRVQSDSINFGGANSSSGSYIMEDTMGEIATGFSSSTNYAMFAGYQQMTDVLISVVPPTDVVMSPSIGGITGGISNGSTVFTVTTDNPAGYSVTIKASSSPALVSETDSFADYSPAGSDPDFSFSITSSESAFAFSPEGNDIATAFKDDGLTCNLGSGDSSLSCWDGLSTSAKTVVNRTTSNTPSGTLTTLRFRASSGSNHVQSNGTYTATTTITVFAL